MKLHEIIGAQKSREEALEILKSSEWAYKEFSTFKREHQEDILAFIQGNKGLPILYDGFFKYVFDPERHPERLEDFLSEILGQKIKIEEVLAREGNKLVEEGTLVVMDIIVRLSDGTIVDVEMQKIGYAFTGQRSSCYLSDMIMRQYNRVKAQKQKDFKFSHMKPVYLVVLLEKSTPEFLSVAPAFIHRLQNTFDSGVNVKMLSNLVYISLDTFRDVRENISDKLVAWLTFLSSDRPEDMLRLVDKYPEFIECYRDIMRFRTNPEELITMFSEALIQMDKNTMKYMIEEQQKELEQNRQELEQNRQELEQNRQELEQSCQELEQNRQELEQSYQELEQSRQELEQKRQELETTTEQLETTTEQLEAATEQLETTTEQLEAATEQLEKQEKALVAAEGEIAEMKRIIAELQAKQSE